MRIRNSPFVPTVDPLLEFEPGWSPANRLPYPVRLQRRLAYFLLTLFCFLGPLGRLLPIPGSPDNFRIFYLLLVPAALVFLQTTMTRSAAYRLIGTLLIVAVIGTSAIRAASGSATGEGLGESPLSRAGLLIALFLFSVFAGHLTPTLSDSQRLALVSTYLKAYAISVAAGFFFMFASDVGGVSFSTFRIFHVISDEGYGMRRFSPGSYPNEYGNVSSFALSSLLLLIFECRRKQMWGARRALPFRRFALNALLVPFALTGLFMATTRSAYISFVLSVLYVLLRSRVGLSSRMSRGFLVLLALALPLGVWKADVIQNKALIVTSVIRIGFVGAIEGSASVAQRFDVWKVAFRELKESPWWGAGFGKFANVHNLYLQFAAEIGFGGITLLLLGGFITYWFSRRDVTHDAAVVQVLEPMRNLAIFHVLFFGLSNHNLNHHLTWFACLLCLLAPRLTESENGPEPYWSDWRGSRSSASN